MAFLYRGVHAHHPELHNVRNGIVMPGKLDGQVTPEEHNRGGRSAVSPFTSWTPNKELALSYACSEKGHGTLLRVDDRRPEPEEGWRWVDSPNHYAEQEKLLYGIRLNVEVLERELPCRGDGEIAEGWVDTSL